MHIKFTQKPARNPDQRLVIDFGNHKIWSDAAEQLVAAADASLPLSATRDDVIALLVGPKLNAALAGTPVEYLLDGDERFFTNVLLMVLSYICSPAAAEARQLDYDKAEEIVRPLT